MQPIGHRLTGCLGVALLLLACTGPMQALRPTSWYTDVMTCPDGCRDHMKITYLGSSGFLIRGDRGAVMTGPLLSNPGLLKALLPVPVLPDSDYIDTVLNRINVRDVGAILIGHSHYDHLLDVPYIARKHATSAFIFGGPTTGHILAGDTALRPRRGAGRVRVIAPQQVGSWRQAGQWLGMRGSRIRFMALESEHAPNFADFTYAPGVVRWDLRRLPPTLSRWKAGESYAYMIELLRADSSVAFRLYYTDAVSRPPKGFPPPVSGSDSSRVDVAILCVGTFGQVSNYPEDIIRRTKPRLVVLGHWEDFFRNHAAPERVIPFTDTRELVRRVKRALPAGSARVTPRRWSTIRLCIC